MSLLDHIRRILLERRIRVLSVDLARARDILADLEADYAADCYNSHLYRGMGHGRDRIDYLEDQRNQLQFQLSALSCSPSSS